MTATPALPVTIVSGYLGAGKTTLVNRLLAGADDRKLAVLVNDFGEIAIDEELIVNRSGETIALANGCVCCSIGGDLYDAIDRILRSPIRPDHLVLETSGVADPGKVLQVALAEPDLEAFGIVTLVDAVNLRRSYGEPLLKDTIERQIAGAGLLLLTKGELAGEEEARQATALVRAIAPRTPLLIAAKDGAPADLVLSRLGGADDAAGAAGHDHHHDAVYRSWTFTGDAVLSAEALDGFVCAADLAIYRMKGFVRLTSGATVEVQRVGDTWQVEEAESSHASTRLVAIGLASRFSPEAVEARWRQSLSRTVPTGR